jgi:uncharacterized protein YndB with AHSA1/START domain
MDFDNAVTINRPTAEVFTFLSDFENVPLWNYAIGKTRRTDTGPLGVGARYAQVRTVPTHSSEAFEVTEFRPDQLIAIRGTLGPFRAGSSYRLEDIDGRTLLTNSIRLEATGVRRLAAALAGSQARSAVAANLGVLKQLLEGRPSTL